MATIKCGGDCTRCEHLRNGETNPSECASIWGFMGVQKMHANMVAMHQETLEAIRQFSQQRVKAIPGIEYPPNETIAEVEVATPSEPTAEV